MSAQRLQYITIDEVINSYLDRSEQSVHKFFKCWHIAFDGMNQLGLDFFYQIKSVKLPINANKTVTLPEDYLNYTKIGVFNNKGEVIPLNYNNKLTTYADLLPDRITKTEDNSLYDLSVNNCTFYNYRDAGVYGNLYGLPSGQPFVGSFKLDNANGVILLDHHFSYDYIVLEYLSSPLEGEQYYVPVFFKEALMWFIAWHDISMMPNTRKGSLGDKEQRKRNYFNERRLANARYRPFRIEDALQASQEQTRLAVKG
jgi:hypothetical protein